MKNPADWAGLVRLRCGKPISIGDLDRTRAYTPPSEGGFVAWCCETSGPCGGPLAGPANFARGFAATGCQAGGHGVVSRAMKALRDPQSLLTEGLAAIRKQYRVPEGFPPEVLAAAESAAARVPSEHADWTGRAFVTLDPASSTDLDQAFAIEAS